MKIVQTLLVLILSSNLVLSQAYDDNVSKSDSPVKTSSFKFEKATPFVIKKKTSINIVSKPKVKSLSSFDLSFLKDYKFKTYNMGDYYFDSSLICMPFNEWGSHVIPYHLKQQTFSVMKKKKK